MTLSEELVWRGFVQSTTLKDIKELDKAKSKVFYHGFDASADSQVIGNLSAMMMDKLFIRHGWKAVLLAGGATSLVGDPGGKDKERPMQSEETIALNIKNAEKQINSIFDGLDFTLVNNLDWYKQMTVLDFLREIGKHFSMTPLIQRDYIAKRMGEGGEGISFTEFSYTLLQGYDFLKLYRDYKVTLQLAGSDQWGNGLSGVDLIRRVEGQEVDVITMPLIINKSTGKKFGKSEDGAIWLDADKTSVFQFYQFWLNVSDDSVADYLKIFTELDKDKIGRTMKEFEGDKKARFAQKTLAYEVTKIVHGQKRASSVIKATEMLFGAFDPNQLGQDEIDLLSTEIPILEAEENLVATIISSGLATSNSQVLRLINDGAVSINQTKVNESANFETGYNLIKIGKNKFALVKSS